MANRGAVRPTQTGPRFKTLRAAILSLSLPSFFFLPVLAIAIYHLRGPVIPSRLRVSDLYTYAHPHATTRGPPTREYVRITVRRRISFDHIPSSKIIGSATYGVFVRETVRRGRIVRSYTQAIHDECSRSLYPTEKQKRLEWWRSTKFVRCAFEASWKVVRISCMYFLQSPFFVRRLEARLRDIDRTRHVLSPALWEIRQD